VRACAGPSLDEAFDPKLNALNLWRLVMATGVILWHSWPLTGRELGFAPLHQLLRDGFVDGFFAISGFLITWSWFRRPRLRDYVLARAVRILPGLWGCLIVTAFVIAPLSVAVQGGSAVGLAFSRAALDYVLGNSAVLVQRPGIAGTPLGVPWPGEWDGSLWTLFWEMLCYFVIAALGVTGLLRRRWLVPALFVAALIWSLRLPALNSLAEQAPDRRPPMDSAAVSLFLQQAGSRFALMFLAGALLFQFRTVVPARWSLVAASAVLVATASLLPNYRVLAAIPLAYLLIASGALLRHPRLRLRNDLSYGVFAAIATAVTLPLAAASWFLIEQPALSLKTRRRAAAIAR
jgi:peptidoglycan/LPS O-acetylase OafA/YrhL